MISNTWLRNLRKLNQVIYAIFKLQIYIPNEVILKPTNLTFLVLKLNSIGKKCLTARIKKRRGHLAFHGTTISKRQKEDQWNETLCAKCLGLNLLQSSEDLVNRLRSAVVYLCLRGNHCLPSEFNEFPPFSSKNHCKTVLS